MTLPTHGPYVNRFGRRGGRGWRPWMLLPKIIAVAVWVGGLAVLLFLAWQPVDAATQGRFQLMERVMQRLLMPAFGIAALLGVMLLLDHPRVFLRARWLQVKLVLIFLVLPLWWHWAGAALEQLHADSADGPQLAAALTALRLSLGGCLVVSVVIVMVGRHKPRLDQRYAKR